MKYLRRLNLPALALTFTKARPGRMLLLALVVGGLALVGSHADTNAGHGPSGTKLWGYEAGTAGRILEYDIGTDMFVGSCLPVPSGSGRGIAFDPVDGNLWYTYVSASFTGDGLIHKAAPPAGGVCTPKGSIPFADGPAPVGSTFQDDVGAMDVDPDDGNIWVAGYRPFRVGTGFTSGLNCNPNFNVCRSFLYKINRVTGQLVLNGSSVPIWCYIPFGGGGAGNDTLTVAVIASVAGNPAPTKYLLTDGGEGTTFDTGNRLHVVDAGTCANGAAATVVASVPKPRTVDISGMTGIDYEDIDGLGAAELIGTDLDRIYNLKGYPFSPPATNVMSALPSFLIEDITLETPSPPTCAITIWKQAAGGGGTEFEFSSTSGVFGPTLTAGSGISILVPCGSFHNLFETPTPGWVLTDITCTVVFGTGSFSFGSPPNFVSTGFHAGDTGVSFNLDPGSHLECFFTNTPVPPEPTPCCTFKTWTLHPYWMGPQETVADETGLTNHVGTPTMVTAIGAGCCVGGGGGGLLFWNPRLDNFQGYQVTGGGQQFAVDINRGSTPCPGLPFGGGDTWGTVYSNGDYSAYVNFKGTTSFERWAVGTGTIDIRVNSLNGKVYLTDFDGSGILELDPCANLVQEWGTGNHPDRLVLDRNNPNFVWATAVAGGGYPDQILRLDTTTGTITRWDVPGGGFSSSPAPSAGLSNSIAMDLGDIWFTESASNEIGRLSLTSGGSAGFIDEFKKPVIVDPQAIATSGAGAALQVFFTCATAGQVCVLTPNAPGVTPTTHTSVTGQNPSITYSAFFVSPVAFNIMPVTVTLSPTLTSVVGTDPSGIACCPIPPSAPFEEPQGITTSSAASSPVAGSISSSNPGNPFGAFDQVFTLNPCKCVKAPPGMRAWWPLDETSGSIAADISGGRTGNTMFGPGGGSPTPLNSASGPASLLGQQVANSFAFGGSPGSNLSPSGAQSFVSVPDSGGNLSLPGDFTIDAWIKVDPADAPGVHTIVDKRVQLSGSPLVLQGYALYLSGGNLGLELADGVGTGNCTGSYPSASSCTNYTSSTNVATGVWVHVAATVQRSGSVLLYVNGGAPVLTGNARPGVPNISAPLLIGKGNPFAISDTYFKGDIDEVEIFNRALSQTEIHDIYAALSAGKCRGPVGGSVALSVSGSGSPFPALPLAAGAAAAMAVLAACGWYARRRWLR